MSIENLQCQFVTVNHLAPRAGAVFSWHYGRDTAMPQTVTVTLKQQENTVWSHTVSDAPVVRLAYDGPLLQPAARYDLCVSAVLADGRVETAQTVFDTVPEVAQQLGSSWIWLDNEHVRPYVVNEHYTGCSSPYFRRRFSVDGTVKRALLYASALGVYELHLNGERVGEDFFAPGWTDYRRRIPFQAYDVTAQLCSGDNQLEACLGDGWYRGFIIFHDRNYGDIPLKLFCCLRLEYEDGRCEIIGGDENWQAGTGPLRYSDFQMGEWYVPAPTDGSDAFFCHPVCAEEDEQLTARLVPQMGPPICKIAEFTPRLLHWHNGRAILDVGQNIAGFVKMTLRGLPADRLITVTYGEMLEADGGIYTANLRIAEQVDKYTTMGAAEEVYRPHFTIHGFQYIAVDGLCPDEWSKVTVVAEALSTDCRPAGSFVCGDALINKLYSNILWGQRGNFSSVPTDCPQRNERLGWTGDAQIFCATACYNMDCQTYYQKYCQDMEDGQMENGAVPDVIPLLYSTTGDLFFEQGNAAWADAGIIIPWRLYTFYRNREHLRKCYPSMKRYAEFLLDHSVDGVYSRADYGDWLNIQEDTVREVLGTAYAAYDMSLMAKAAEVLGLDEEALFYRQQFERIKEAFHRHFVDENSRILGHTQTAYVVALRFGLAADDQEQKRFTAHLTQRIEERDGHLSSGFVGISYLLPVLCENGRTDLAYDLLLTKTYPSWLYSVVNGATTIWERWNSYTRENGFGDVAMNSFNHYSLGSVGEWFYSHCAGIVPVEDGVELRPYPDERLGYCRASYLAVGGRVESSWCYENGGITFRFFVPSAVKATAWLPACVRDGQEIYSDSARLAKVLAPGEHIFFLPVS